MVISGEIKCYHCGYVSGLATGEAERPLKEWRVSLAPVCDARKVWRERRLHCCRCGGPIFLDQRDVMQPRSEVPPPEE